MENAAYELVKLLKEKNLHIAVAESCTGGLLSKSVTDIPGASAVYELGVTSYSERIKTKVLGVKPGTLKNHTVYSRETALEMAHGVLDLSDADIALAVTGVAGPGADTQTGTPEGTVYIAAVSKNTELTEKLSTSFTENVREQNRIYAAKKVFELGIKLINGENNG